MILKPTIDSTEPPKSVDTEEDIASEDLEVVWDAQWAPNHPSNRPPTQRPRPIIVYDRCREPAPTYVDDANDENDEDDVPTIEIATDVVLPLVRAMVIG